jgi:phenylalanyl-tRNA synthetase beta chain
MPTVTVDCLTLWSLVGKTLEDEQFENLCFEFGIELEDIMTKSEISGNPKDTQKVYRIDIPANRYDMLCVEGIAQAIKIYLNLGKLPVYSTLPPTMEITVQESTAIRPFVVCAVLRDFEFNKDRYDGFIELQDKLHNNICRKRTLVAIGTHDLDTIEAPFVYKCLKPEEIKFIPLNQTKTMNAVELMEFYQQDRKLSKFLHIIKDSPTYPVIYDSKDRVLSLPPIINSDHSKIKMTTKNIFIECTATDLTKAKIVLNTIVTMFSRYCLKPFTVEQVKVICANDKSIMITPQLGDRSMSASVDYINSCVGIKQSPSEIADLLEKMSLVAIPSADGKSLQVSIPPTRSDILHQCDIMEDAAIGYNFNKIVETIPKLNTIAVPLPINKLGDSLRKEMAFAGFTEALGKYFKFIT